MLAVKRSTLYLGLLTLVLVATVLMVAHFYQEKQDVSSGSALQGTATGGVPDLAPEPLSERIEKLPPQDREIARNAKKSIEMYKDKDGNYILIEVDGKKIHEDPTKKFLKDYRKSAPEDTLDTLPADTDMIREVN